MFKEREFVWDGEERNRTLAVSRPCRCGSCVTRGFGYLSGSDANGNGFTIWIEHEEVFRRLELAFGREAV